MQTSAHDVAAYILDCLGPMRAMKLQKLVYYGQVWSLAWSGNPLFVEPIQAWKDGPITRALWNRHKGRDVLRKWNGNPDALSIEQKTVLNRVLVFYGRLSGNDLSALTHSEKPWSDAREGLQKHEPGTREISHQALREYYRDADLLVNSSNLQEMVSTLLRPLGMRSAIDHKAAGNPTKARKILYSLGNTARAIFGDTYAQVKREYDRASLDAAT